MFSCIEANRPTTETAGGNNTDGDVGTAACSVPQRTKTLNNQRHRNPSIGQNRQIWRFLFCRIARGDSYGLKSMSCMSLRLRQ